MQAPLPTNETDRLAALYDLNVLDSAPEKDFDDIVALAASVCGVPMALVVAGRHRPAVVQGAGRDRSDGDVARHVVLRARDPRQGPAGRAGRAQGRPRFADNPRSSADGGIRFYAGAPLITTDGFALGTLCVIDSEPRRLDVEQLQALRALARQVTVAAGAAPVRRPALANTTARLQELERRKDDLAGLVGGELRAPLRLMRAYLADLGDKGVHDPELAELVGRATAAHVRGLHRPARPPDLDGRGRARRRTACTCGRST